MCVCVSLPRGVRTVRPSPGGLWVTVQQGGNVYDVVVS
jgi:hypothetical protein